MNRILSGVLLGIVAVILLTAIIGWLAPFIAGGLVLYVAGKQVQSQNREITIRKVN